MKYETKQVKKDVVQYTFEDERFYKIGADGDYLPSVTYICDFYPKGIAFYKWLANKGWDEAQAQKEEAGAKGSIVHQAVEDLLNGETVKHDAEYVDNRTGDRRELDAKEYRTIQSFQQWYEEVNPKILDKEFLVYTDKYAGTVDMLCEIQEKCTSEAKHKKAKVNCDCELKTETWLIDLKTSANIWASHELQVSAYKHALPKIKIDHMAILQVGYDRNKTKKWKLTEVEDKFSLFEGAYKVWENETKDREPKSYELPLEIKL